MMRSSRPLNPAVGPMWLPGNPLLRRLTLALMDGFLLAAGLAINFIIWLEYRHGHVPDAYASLFTWVVVPMVVLRLGLYAMFGLYRSISRHAGNYELLLIALAGTIATSVIIVGNFFLSLIPSLGAFPMDPDGIRVLRMPWGIVFNDWMFGLILTTGVRVLRREVVGRWLARRAGLGKRVLIVGAGDTGAQVARDLERETQGGFRPVAYVDPNPAMKGNMIHGVPVAGTLDTLAEVIQEYNAEELVIALQRPTPRVISEIIDHCRTARLSFRLVPTLDSVMRGGVAVSMLRPVEIEDLLGREPVDLSSEGRPACLKGLRVLVTGAGGSIGRELCRQALAQSPAAIILLGRGENSIFETLVDLDSEARRLGVVLKPVIADVRDVELIEQIFKLEQPEVVFHAAAHKHVHFMEQQPCEAVKNNILGTLSVTRASALVGVERFILISTDKAVRPTGVMGASKRVAEMIVSSMAARGKGIYVSVRFGNVLGSRGSVVPTFRRQIEQGGPVTVTHPDVTRYFMTIPEAVNLVIEAGAVGKGGELFMLDMGKPVKISELARNLITLSGYEPDVDIAIEYTGLRPGEKLNEELLTSEEGITATGHGKLFIARNTAPPWEKLRGSLEALATAAEDGDNAKVIERLKALVPDYTPGGHVASSVATAEPHPVPNSVTGEAVPAKPADDILTPANQSGPQDSGAIPSEHDAESQSPNPAEIDDTTMTIEEPSPETPGGALTPRSIPHDHAE